MTNYKLQLERLKRHYEASVGKYDIISFHDLANTLRIWTEIKSNIDHLNINSFKKGIFDKKIKRILNGAEYVYTYLPDGVTTSALATGETESRNVVYGPRREKFSSGSYIKIEESSNLTIAQFLLIYRDLLPAEVRILSDQTKNISVDRVNFSQYMASPAVYFQLSGQSPKHISNEELIKRVANEYEASHANAGDTHFDVNNVFSEPVKNLMQYGCASLPLPYFILLHIAKTIIDNLEGKLP